jgi:hypothetical protein
MTGANGGSTVRKYLRETHAHALTTGAPLQQDAPFGSR